MIANRSRPTRSTVASRISAPAFNVDRLFTYWIQGAPNTRSGRWAGLGRNRSAMLPKAGRAILIGKHPPIGELMAERGQIYQNKPAGGGSSDNLAVSGRDRRRCGDPVDLYVPPHHRSGLPGQDLRYAGGGDVREHLVGVHLYVPSAGRDAPTGD